MTAPLRTVIIPAAGKGSRLLPLTKVVPKEMLPVHDRPVLQFAVEEAVLAGAERVVIVIHPSKMMIRDYLARDDDAVRRLRLAGKPGLADALESAGVSAGEVEVVFATQPEALGLGHAVLCAAAYVLPGPLGVILPDDVILDAPALVQMAAAYRGGHMIAAMAVPLADTTRYGIFELEGPVEGRCVRATGMVEKPPLGFAPSSLAAVGRYVLDPCILSTLATLPAGRGGEIQLTDAITRDARHLPLTAYRFSGTRHDCGSFEGLISAGVAQMARATRQLPCPASADGTTRHRRVPQPEEAAAR